MPPLEADFAVLVNDLFFETTHGRMACTDCHGGERFATDRKTAHEGMNPRPSADFANSVCVPCHEEISTGFVGSLHATTRGVSGPEGALVAERTSDVSMIKDGLANNCSTCHVSGCGDCHVTRPQFNDGGFVQGHVFYKSPNSSLNCMGCHGSRIEKEFTGAGEMEGTELEADVHWSPGGMQCVDCHPKEWIHSGKEYPDRYSVEEAPKCTDCHPADEEFTRIAMHAEHATGDSEVHLQCQVCHSQPYNNCWNCHVGLTDEGLPVYKTDSSEFGFKIGRNYRQGEDRPWDYIVVRHVPVFPGVFDSYGKDALDGFATMPTWKYATPHSIQRMTPQTEGGCTGCHGNRDFFLTEGMFQDDPLERDANKDVLILDDP